MVMSRSRCPCVAVIHRRYSLRCRCLRQRLQQAVEIRRCSACLFLQPRNGRREARRRKRLHHVVDRALLERGDRILVVGGDEHDVASLPTCAPLRGPTARHLDVEKQDVGLMCLEGAQRFDSVFRLGAISSPATALRAIPELAAQQRLVFGDDGPVCCCMASPWRYMNRPPRPPREDRSRTGKWRICSLVHYACTCGRRRSRVPCDRCDQMRAPPDGLSKLHRPASRMPYSLGAKSL